MKFEMHLGDCLDVMKGLDIWSVDAIVTDPPAGIGFMGKEWDNFGGRINPNAQQMREDDYDGYGEGAQPFGCGGSGPPTRKQRGEFVAFMTERLVEARYLAKPGAYALIWALPRTSHWTATAIEDAGWRVVDRLAHVFGTGFPKHKSKLKPSVEDWWLAWNPDGKATPMPGIDACRVAPTGEDLGGGVVSTTHTGCWDSPWKGDPGAVAACRERSAEAVAKAELLGRWPTHLLLSHSPGCSESCVEGCPIRLMGEQSGTSRSLAHNRSRRGWTDPVALGSFGPCDSPGYSDAGTAARFFTNFTPEPDPFFYCAKASSREKDEGLDELPLKPCGTMGDDNYPMRTGSGNLRNTVRPNVHPTVKPQALMSWLVTLITPPGGVVLDPFTGSGSTGVACAKGGFGFIGIEKEAEYFEIARRRIEHAFLTRAES